LVNHQAAFNLISRVDNPNFIFQIFVIQKFYYFWLDYTKGGMIITYL